MAIVSATAFKAAIATAAADLTTALTDDTVTHTALEISNPMHPLRQIEKFFTYNAATGVVASDDAYIDAAYAGATPSKGNPFDAVSNWLPLTLVSATVEDAEPSDVVLTFSRAISNYSNVSVGGDAPRGVTGTAIVTVVATVTVSAPYVNGDVITISGTFRTLDGATIQLATEAVTNNVAA